MIQKLTKIGFAEIILLLSLLCVGIFHEFLSCFLSVILLAYLLIKLIRGDSIRIYCNMIGLAVSVIVLGYGLSVFWALDRGMAFIGFLKFLPVPLYLLVLMQQDKTERIIVGLPWLAAGMTVVSAIGMQIPNLTHLFSSQGRLAGFFQYPNAFALFLLVAELIVISKENRTVADAVIAAILLFGMLYSGSRTTFVLLVAFNFVFLLFGKISKRVKIFALSGIAVAVMLAAGFAVLSGNFEAFGRFLTISLREKNLMCRLLYYQDALPVILKHPLGLGYLGFHYIQQSIQNGVYFVRFVHNDFLQILLDVGWLPFSLFVTAVVASFCSKRLQFSQKIILIAIIAHCMLEFDLQYIAIFFVLLLFMDFTAGKQLVLSKGKVAVGSLWSGMAVVCLYCGIALFFTQIGRLNWADMMYPWNTENSILLLVNQNDLTQMNRLADKILKQNEYVQVAYSAQARYVYAQGDFAQVIRIKRTQFEKAPFAYKEYEEYATMLMRGIELYKQAGDSRSADICKKELLWVKHTVENLESRLSPLAVLTGDKPTTQLPDEVLDYIDGIKDTG